MRFLFTLLFFQLFSFNAHSQSAYTKTDLNLRTNANTRSSIIGVIPKGEKLAIQYCTTYWCKVQYQNSYNGFVSKRYLTKQTISKEYTYRTPTDKPIILPRPTKEYYINSFGET